MNGYLLRGDPLTLVDPGPLAHTTLAGLEDALARERVQLEDIELLILTHQHGDHVGLAATVVERSGCAVAAQPSVAALLRDVDATRAAETLYQQALLELHGAPAEELAHVAEIAEFARAFTVSVDVTVPLVPGETVMAGGHDLLVCARPGHSATDTILVAGDGWALVADHLTARGRAIVVALPSAEDVDPRARPPGLLRYRESLAATAALGLQRAYPGHGGVIDDPRAAVDLQLELQERRAEELLERLGSAPVTAWELAVAPRSGQAHLYSEGFVGLSDVLSHLDLLEAQGHVRSIDGDVIRYERRST